MIRLASLLRPSFATALALLFFAFLKPGTGQAPQQAPFVTHSLKPNVYWGRGWGGNSGVIVGVVCRRLIISLVRWYGQGEIPDDWRSFFRAPPLGTGTHQW